MDEAIRNLGAGLDINISPSGVATPEHGSFWDLQKYAMGAPRHHRMQYKVRRRLGREAKRAFLPDTAD
jgi:hypothetical protein